MKEYRLTEGSTILVYTVAPALIFACIWILVYLVPPNYSAFHYLWLTPLALAVIGLMVWAILESKKLVVYKMEGAIGIKSTLVTTELKFDEIEGFRTLFEHTIVIPKEPTKKRIIIGPYLEEAEQLQVWLVQNFKNLNVQKSKEKGILDKPGLHLSEDERYDELKRAQGHAELVNIFGGLVAAWTLFLPQPYSLVIVLSIALPIISIIVTIRYKGFIAFITTKSMSRPTTIIALFFPTCALCLRALLDYNILDYSGLWIPCAFFPLMGVAIVWLSTNQLHTHTKVGWETTLTLPLIFSAYTFGALVTTNCSFDDGPPIVHSVDVLDKWEGDSDATTFHLEIADWRNETETIEATVTRGVYDKAKLEGKVKVYEMPGLYGIPWYLVSN